MKLLFDYFPIFIFFVIFKIYGIYAATAAIMIASFIQLLTYWIRNRRFETLHIITFLLVMILGIPTLLLHDALFIKWKPTAIYWVFAIVFIGSCFIGKKTIIERIMDNKIILPKPVWQKVTISWAIFFAIMGALNIYVAYHFSTNAWVDFKLFGTLGLTIVFIVLQALYLSKHIETKTSSTNLKPPKSS